MKKHLLLAFMTAFPVSCALAADSARTGYDPGGWFTQKDWELVCDNGGTCRAAGYQSDDSDNPVSVLFTRKAGAGSAVDAKLSIVPVGERAGGILYVNGKPLGKFDFSWKTGIVRPLSPKQADALLSALRNQNAAVVFKGADGNVWNLSSEGARETLLKMDELQGRYDAPDAPIQRGRSSRAAANPQPLPVVRPVIPLQQKPREISKGSREYALIDKAVGKYFSDGNPNAPCSASNEPYTVYPLSEKQVLVERSCWQAAYNSANYYGIFSGDLTKLITHIHGVAGEGFELNDYAAQSGTLTGYMKGRGIGDCWTRETHRYNGQTFERVYFAYHGMCKGFPGGAWEMPDFVAKVIETEK